MSANRFDEVLNSFRTLEPEVGAADAAAARVRQNLFGAAGAAEVAKRLESCDDFQSLISGYLRKSLPDARCMLFEDHVRQCVPCRKALEAAREGRLQPARAKVVAFEPRRPALFAFNQWALAAMLLLGLSLGSWWIWRTGLPGAPVASIASIRPGTQVYRVAEGTPLPLGEGVELGAAEVIRTARGGNAVVKLFDGSLVEMDERSEISVSRGWPGTTIRLERGNILVQAAKQKQGRLLVTAGEAQVAVKGTIFTVKHGVKGARVSVVEGAVEVQAGGKTEELKPGQQSTSDPILERTRVADDVAWSRDAARYLAMLGELAKLEAKLDRIPGPGLRYESRLLNLIPADTVFYAGIPNIGNTLTEMKRVFDENLTDSPVLRAWWNDAARSNQRQDVDEALQLVKQFSQQIGREVVVAVRGGAHAPVVLAEAGPGLEALIQQQVAKHGAPREPLPYAIHKGIFIAADRVSAVAEMRQLIDRGGPPATPFTERIGQSYRQGAEWLFAADMEQITRGSVQKQQSTKTAMDLGFDNAQYLVLERREVAGRVENTGVLNFRGERHGVPAWLGAPGPLRTLEFVSPDAAAAVSIVSKNPRTIVEELLRLGKFESANFERETGLRVLDDLAAPLGAEATFAIDGPVLQLPWKAAVETLAPQTMQRSLERLVAVVNEQGAKAQPKHSVTLTQQAAQGRTFYTLTFDAKIPVHYTFVDGYWLLGSSRALLTSAIQTRQSGLTLPRSTRFRALLPSGADPNVSGLFYYNAGDALSPVAEQLKNLANAEQQKSLAAVKEMKPGLICAYGEADRITLSSTGSLFGFNLSSLGALGNGGLMDLLKLPGQSTKQ
jgi:hypothetical protein